METKKPYTLAGFEPGNLCSVGGREVHSAIPPSRATVIMDYTLSI
jgi:hypothetical protein